MPTQVDDNRYIIPYPFLSQTDVELIKCSVIGIWMLLLCFLPDYVLLTTPA